MTSKPTIGWPTAVVACTMRQGASGGLEAVLLVLNDDDTPLDTYDGWTALLRLWRDPQRKVVLSIDPVVVGDDAAHTLTVSVRFVTADTAAIAAGNLIGDVCLISPEGERHFPIELRLELQRANAPEPIP